MDDIVSGFQARIAAAAAARTPLRIRAGGTKDFYGASSEGELLDVAAYRGIVDYEPKELVLTVRAGTPLDEIERALEADGQMLPFEPPHFGAGATIGGTVAAGLSGPRRAFTGAVRDFVLGTRIIDGKGQDLSFGGRVIKNVAGYDVSRLMAGAFGMLGVLLDISFKVLPRPAEETTLRFAMDEVRAIETMNRWMGMPLPLSATYWHHGVLYIRISGSPAGVAAARAKLGGEEHPGCAAFWRDVREQRTAFFGGGDGALWRLSVPSTAAPLLSGSHQAIEWGGALRWLRSQDRDAAAVRAAAAAAGGHATLFRGGDKSAGVFQPLAEGVAALQRRLKDTFDPADIFNPGRMDNFR